MEIEDLIKTTRDKSKKLDALQESLRSFNEMKKHLQGEKTTENQKKTFWFRFNYTLMNTRKLLILKKRSTNSK